MSQQAHTLALVHTTRCALVDARDGGREREGSAATWRSQPQRQSLPSGLSANFTPSFPAWRKGNHTARAAAAAEEAADRTNYSTFLKPFLTASSSNKEAKGTYSYREEIGKTGQRTKGQKGWRYTTTPVALFFFFFSVHHVIFICSPVHSLLW